MNDKQELYARLANYDCSDSTYNVDDDTDMIEPVDIDANGDIADLHARVKPKDIELLYARLPSDVLPVYDNQEPLTADQQQLHARIIASGLEQQGYPVDDN